MLKDTDLIAKLSLVGHRATKRGITDWIRKGLLPRRDRLGRGKGKGRGTVYGWNDEEVLLRAYAVFAALTLHWRTKIAMLLVWFSGFDYPIERMWWLWAAFERRQRNQAFAEATGAQDLEDADLHGMVGLVRAYMLRFRMVKRMPSGALEVFLGFFDPKYDPRKMTDDQARDILGYFVSSAKMDSGLKAVLQLLRPEAVRTCAAFLYEHFSHGRLPVQIESSSDQEIAAIHADWHFLAGPYRWALRVSMEGSARGIDHHATLLWMLSRFGWRLGRMMMLIDLSLRRSGHTDRIEQTITKLRSFAGREDIRHAAAALDSAYQATNLSEGPWWSEGQDQKRWYEDFGRRVEGGPDLADVSDKVGELLNALWEIWRPVVEPVFRNMLGNLEPETISGGDRPLALQTAALSASVC